MLFYYENMLENVACSMIESEKSNLEYFIKSYNTKRETFLSYIQKITDGIQRIEFTEHSDLLFEILSSLKDLSKKMSFITASYKNFSGVLDNLSSYDSDFSSKVEEYNSKMKIFQQDFIAFLVESEEFIRKVLKNVEFQFADSIVSKPVTETCKTSSGVPSQIQPQPQIQTESEVKPEPEVKPKLEIEVKTQPQPQAEFEVKPKLEFETKAKPQLQPQIKQDPQATQQDKDVLEDNNCLIISEVQGKVFLPYKVSTLKKLLAEFPEDYVDMNDIITSEYVLPLSQFRNPILSRFKEAYSLMKDTEDATFLEALDFALELSFNSNLNPAIIAACKSRNELNMYLDCLAQQKLDQFKIFDIKYEYNLMVQ